MRTRWLMALLAPLLFGCSVKASETMAIHRDIAYESIPGVAASLTSLDVYTAKTPPAKPGPVVVWVHGGGWAIGDKANRMQAKATLLTSAGYCLVSVNYRLSPRPASGDPKRIMYPFHERDVAAAIAWIHAHIAEYGGDPNRMAIMGHSAGAHLVSIVSTDESFLGAHGLPLNTIKGTVSLDTEGYDIPAHMTREVSGIYENAFGTDPAVWKQASPVNHLARDKGIPPFLVVTRGTPARQRQAADFVSALQGVGVPATLVNAGGYAHDEVNTRLGVPGETVVTPPVMRFLSEAFTTVPKSAPAPSPAR